MKARGWLMVIVAMLASACESVKPYNRAYLNDYEMQPGQNTALRFDDSVQAYREASSGGGSSKVSGGCGCN